MRLSKRERFLLAVLTLLLLWTGFYKFWIEPETDLLFANLQEINRLEEQIKRGGPQGKQNLEQMAEKLEQAGNGQKAFAACRRNWDTAFRGRNRGNKRDGYSRLCVYTSYTGICVYRQGTGSRICGKDQPGRRRYVDKVAAVRKR
mgnify:CR=1 FL=1